jgi:hypothetical protein
MTVILSTGIPTRTEASPSAGNSWGEVELPLTSLYQYYLMPAVRMVQHEWDDGGSCMEI